MQHWEFVVGTIMVIVFIAAVVVMLFFSSAHKLGSVVKENIAMSQWGHERSFSIEDGGYISVTPHVAGPTWEPLRGEHLIDDLIVQHSTTSDAVANRKLAELKTQWVGRPYGEWGVAVGTAHGSSSMTRLAALMPGDIVKRIATDDNYVVALLIDNIPVVIHTRVANDPSEWTLVKIVEGS